MKDISKDIEESIDNYNSTNEFGLLFIDIPIYEAAVQSGNLLVLVDRPYYTDLLKAYSYIKYLAFAESKEDAYSEEDLIRIRTEARNRIDAIKRIIENEI